MYRLAPAKRFQIWLLNISWQCWHVKGSQMMAQPRICCMRSLSAGNLTWTQKTWNASSLSFVALCSLLFPVLMHHLLPVHWGFSSPFPLSLSFSSSRWRGWAHCKTRLMDRMNTEIFFAVVTFREQKLL